MMHLKKLNQHHSFRWTSIVLVTIMVLFVYVLMEWVFLVTKPSFMSSLSFLQQVSILFSVTGLLITIYLIFIAALWLLSRIKIPLLRNLLIGIAYLIPGLVAASLLLLLIDNFTYTVFRFGIVNTTGVVRGLYAALFLALTAISVNEIRKLYRSLNAFKPALYRRIRRIALPVVLAAFVLAGVLPVLKHISTASLSESFGTADRQPNIFIITPDGVNAANMSLYGYERDTTPFLHEMAQSSLVAMNAFTNSANTSGSVISIYNSKSPIETHLLYPPDILKSNDAYQHLPAMLKNMGYYTAQFTVQHYVDAYELNVQNGFDEANGRSIQNNLLNELDQWLPTDNSFYIYEIRSRLVDRLRHIFYIETMSNPLLELEKPTDYYDEDKFSSLLEVLDTVNKPVFAHIHMMGTHGPRFWLNQQVFSIGKDPANQEEWDTDFYDDSILKSDQLISDFVKALEKREQLENSIIVIASDHGQGYVTRNRLPLLIRFPDGKFQGQIDHNVQNMDIAPTILDYLGISQPQWMQGVSLLGEVRDDRPIFAVGVGNVEFEEGSMKADTIKPPFYQFGFASVVMCDNFYFLGLSDFAWHEEKIAGYWNGCHDALTRDESIRLIMEYFKRYNYDTTRIDALLP